MKSNQKLSILLWVFEAKATKDGRAPIYARGHGHRNLQLIDRFVKGPEFDVFAIQEFDFDDLDYHVLTVEGSKFIHFPILTTIYETHYFSFTC